MDSVINASVFPAAVTNSTGFGGRRSEAAAQWVGLRSPVTLNCARRPLADCVAVGTRPSYTAESEPQAMKFVVTITQDEDGMFIAECPSIPGCVSQGKTAEEAQMNVQDAIKECLEVRAEKGMPLTVMTRQVEVHV